MKSEAEATTSLRMKDTNVLADDCYLTEMTERLRRLRSLMGEQEARKSQSKRRARNFRSIISF